MLLQRPAPRPRARLLGFCLALLLAAPAAADVVHMRDGRRLEGVVVARDATTLRLRTRLGEIVLELAQVERVEAGETRQQELERREAEAKSADDLYELGQWARSKRMGPEAKRLFQRALELDAGHEGAHLALGHVRHEGAWMTPEERERRVVAALEAEMRAKGLVRHGDGWVTPADKERLEKGLVLHEGRWITPDQLKREQGLELFDGAWLPRAEAVARGREREVERVASRRLTVVLTEDALLAGPYAPSLLREIGVGLAHGRAWFAQHLAFPPGLEPFGGELPELYLWDDATPAYEDSVPHFASRTRYLPEGWVEAARAAHGFVYWDPSCVSSVRIGFRGQVDLQGHCYHHWGHLLVNRLRHDGRLLPPWYDESMACLLENVVHGQNRVFCRALAGPGIGTVAKRAAFDIDPAELRRGDWRRILREALEAGRAPAFDQVARRELPELETLDVLVGMAVVEWLSELSPDALGAFHAVLRRRAPPVPQRVIAQAAPRQEVYDEAFGTACGMGWRQADQAWRRWLASR